MTKIVWYARCEGLARIGPFSDQVSAWKSLMRADTNEPMQNAAVWPEYAPPTPRARVRKASPTQRFAPPRPLHVIAREIRADWTKVYFCAVPYLDAMGELTSTADSFGEDPAREVVTYFLANANSWRGETAKRIKAELKGMLKGMLK